MEVKIMMKRGIWIGALLMLQIGLAYGQTPKVDFKKDVQPILQNCIGCHGPTQQMNGFRLDRRSDALRGSTIDKPIHPGDSARSLMLGRLVSDQFGPKMPP